MDKNDVKRVTNSIETMCKDSEALSKKLRSSLISSGTILNLADGNEDDRRRGRESLDVLVRHIYEIVIDSYNSQYRIVCSIMVRNVKSMFNVSYEDASVLIGTDMDMVKIEEFYTNIEQAPDERHIIVCYKWQKYY